MNKTVNKQLLLIKETILLVREEFHQQVVEVLHWFNTFLRYQFLNNENKLFTKQWDIYEVNLWRNIGSELNKKRPCLVISSNPFNKGKTVIVAPIKSLKSYTRIGIISVVLDKEWTNLESRSFVSLGNIREVSKKRFTKKIGKIQSSDLKKIKRSLSVFFNINKKRASEENSFLEWTSLNSMESPKIE